MTDYCIHAQGQTRAETRKYLEEQEQLAVEKPEPSQAVAIPATQTHVSLDGQGRILADSVQKKMQAFSLGIRLPQPHFEDRLSEAQEVQRC